MLAVCATALVLVLAALLCTGGHAQRTLSWIVATCALVMPGVMPSLPIFRFVAAIGAVAGLARVLEMAGERPPRNVWSRVLQVLVIVDWRVAQRVSPTIAAKLIARSALHLFVTAGAIALVVFVREARVPGALPLGWLFGALAVWAFAESASSIVTAALLALGWRVVALHDRPVESRSLAELWGSRWNLTVSRWLRAHIFVPLARRHHARLGLAAAFTTSALFHAYIAGVSGSFLLALVMGAFFVVQGALMALERPLGVPRWPRAAARVWFFVAILAPSPLFVEPMIAITLARASPLYRPRV